MRVAIVHDWLVSYAGSERVVSEFAQLFPDAPIYASVYDESEAGGQFPPERVRTTFLQKIPFARRFYQKLLPLMPLAFEQLDLREYDLVISSSHACSKGVLVRSDAVHICYCHTPIRYVWSHYHDYIETIRGRFSRQLAAVLLHRLRQWDYVAAQRVDYFVANSTEVKDRIRKYYGRDSVVIHPPVDVPPPEQERDSHENAARAESSTGAGDYYLSLGRLVPYKRVDLAVRACSALGKRLIVAGDGPELGELKKLAGPTVEFVGAVPETRKAALLTGAQALLFCGEEDFGIVPVEACQVGTPVIGFGKGGLLDSVATGMSGILFSKQSVQDVMDAILQFEQMHFDPQLIQEEAQRFSPQAFRAKWTSLLESIHIKDGGDYAT